MNSNSVDDLKVEYNKLEQQLNELNKQYKEEEEKGKKLELEKIF